MGTCSKVKLALVQEVDMVIIKREVEVDMLVEEEGMDRGWTLRRYRPSGIGGIYL